jgi:hypothetical protein
VHRLLVLCCLALLALIGPAHPAQASRAQTVSFEAPRDLLNPSSRERTLDEIQGMGVTALRVILYWRDVAPQPRSATPPTFDSTDPAQYNWTRYDPLVDAAVARGMTVLMTISGPVPRWATLSRRDQYTRPSPDRYAQFVEAVGRHYTGKVAIWSIFNEPNHPDFLRPQFFRGQPASGIWYRKLWLAGYKGLKRAGIKKPKVLFGETAPVGTSHVVAPITFLETALCIDKHSLKVHRKCKKLPVYGYAHHAYTKRQGPFFNPPNHNDVTIGALIRLKRALDHAGRTHKFPRKLPIYLTEFGIQSVPDPLYGVSQYRQNEYRAISERWAWQNPRVKWFSQYLMRDDNHLNRGPKLSRYPGFESGLKFANGKRKVAFKSFALPLAALRSGSGVTLWGGARAAHGKVTVTVLANGRRYKTITTDSRGFFLKRVRYVKGRKYQLRWNGATSAPVRVYSR